MNQTKIEWCDITWNPVTGCYHGCEYCYAKKQTKRFEGWAYTPGKLKVNVSEDKTYIHPMKAYYGEAKETQYGKIAEIKAPFLKEDGSKAPYPFGFMPTFHRYKLDQPKKLKKPRTIFVGSMADLFGKWVPDEWIEEVFESCKKAPQHRYLFLTKNPNRYIELAKKGLLPQFGNMWFGYSATKQEELWRFKHADECPVKNLFVSIEPILGYIEAGFSSHCPADWVIIGAETGNRKNKVTPKREWIEQIAMECEYSDIPIFMKNSLIPIWGEQLITQFPWSK